MAETCEAWIEGKWQIRTIEEHLKSPSRYIRCVECHGAFRPHRKGKGVAHFEHRAGHSGCSLAQDFNGKREPHPEPVDTPRPNALYINGVFKRVLDEILAAQKSIPTRVCFLQPYSHKRIKELAENPPSPSSPLPLYISLTDSLDTVSYKGSIVGWYDKSDLSINQLSRMNRHIAAHQPGEKEIYFERNKKKCVNLIEVLNLEHLSKPISVSSLRKTSDNLPLKSRSQSGGWAYVYALDTETAATISIEAIEADFQRRFAESSRLSDEERRRRLKSAPKKPAAMTTTTTIYRRNTDVQVEVLFRANGQCEKCKRPAPFLRKSDGSPFLEVHHIERLCDGGDDTVENCLALCPNCHRKVHHGTKN